MNTLIGLFLLCLSLLGFTIGLYMNVFAHYDKEDDKWQ